MAFCEHCGTQLNDSMNVCPGCNAPNPHYQAPQQPAQNMGTAFGTNGGQNFGTNNVQNNGQNFGVNNGQNYGTNNGQQYGQSNQQNYQNNTQQAYSSVNNVGDHTAEFDPNDIANNKGMGVLAYFGILILIPIFAAPQSRFARFHSNQGLILIIASIINVPLSVILAFIPFIGGLLSLACTITLLVFMIMGIVYAAQGKAKDLPLIGSFKILK